MNRDVTLKKDLPKKLNKLFTTKALETANQMLAALITHLKRNKKEVVARRKNATFSNNPANK